MLPPVTRRQAVAAGVVLFSTARYLRAAAPPLPRAILLPGRAADPAPPLLLQAGPVTAEFEPGLGILRYVRYGDREILRVVYAAVRDKVWGTVAPRVSNVVLESRDQSFRLTFTVDNVEGDIDFGWQGIITGSAQGTVRFEFNGRARSTFMKNRLGFAVLHPIKECAGKPCQIEKAGGLKDSGVFPLAISPNQPFVDMATISHEVAPGVTAEVRFEGDLFEMEDHRNWTDGSYKTYCTPLGHPFPVAVSRGQEVKQAVTVKLIGETGVSARAGAPPELIVEAPPGAKPVPLPAIGFGFAAGNPPFTALENARLKVLRPAHLRVDLVLAQPDWARTLSAAAAIALVEAAVFVSSANAEAELKALAAQTPPGRIARWLLFNQDEKVTQPRWADLARRLLPRAPLVIGTNEYFTELNRERPAVASLDGSCYSINPQVHAFDNRSLVENLEAQADTVRSAQNFLNGKPVHVSPVTLKPRFNPQAKGQPEVQLPGRLPSRLDARQMSLFGAAWTLGSIKYLAEAGANSITYYETIGWAGLMELSAGAPMPELFPSLAGSVFPLYHVFANVAEFAGGQVHRLSSSDPLQTCALALATPARRRILLANLTSQARIVTLNGNWLGPRARVVTLDESNVEAAMREPEQARAKPGALMESAGGVYRLPLLPYAILRLDRV